MPKSSGSNGDELARVIGGRNGSAWIAGLRVDECKRVMTQGEVRAQIDGLLQFDNGLVMTSAQPQRPAHGPVCRRVAVVHHEAVPGGLERPVDFRLALRPALECVLEMREGQAGIGARERRIEAHRHLEEMPGLLVVGLVEPIHVPKPAVMCLPRVQRVRWPQHGAVALAGLDLVGDGRNDPVADLIEHEERVVEFVIEAFGPDDPRGPRLGQFNRHGKAPALTPHGSGDDVVDVQHPTGLFRTDASLMQGEHAPLRDDEQAPQLGEPGDHVVSERIGNPAAGTRRGGSVGKRHHRDGGTARCNGGDVVTKIAVLPRSHRERLVGRSADCLLAPWLTAMHRELDRSRGPRLRTAGWSPRGARCPP